MRPCLLVLVLALGGCVWPTDPVRQLSLSLTLGSPVMLGDAGIRVEVEARNNSPIPVAIVTYCGLPVIGIHVIPPGSVDAPPSEGVRFPCERNDPQEPVTVPAGGSLIREFTIRPTRVVSGGSAVRWPEGVYRVTAFLRARDGGPVNETDPQTFRLVCSEPNATAC